jgi:two-component system sensor histidine kinase DesK
MDASERPTAAAPRYPWAFAVAFLCLAMLAGAGIAVYWAGPAAGVVAAAAFALPLLYAVPRGRALWARHRNRLLTAQALLTYLPFAIFEGDWIAGLPGLLGGLLLLTVAPPVSWLLFAAALAADGVLRFAVVGLPHLAGLSEATLVFVIPIYSGMALFGLVRLAGLVTELHATRTELATLTVAGERLRAGEHLRAAIGDRLDTVAAHARAARAALARAPDEARAKLGEAAGDARQALDQVRLAVADDWRIPRRVGSAGQTGGAEPTLAPRLARLVLALVLVILSVQLAVDTVVDRPGHASRPGGLVAAVSVAAIAVLVALQLYHSTARRERARPRGWGWTLSAQLVLTGFGFVPVLHPAIHGLSGFVAGSALLLLPRYWGWIAFAGIQAAIAAHVLVLPRLDAADFVYLVLVTVTTGLVVYGLSRLTGLAVELDQTRRELARMAAVRERLRVAQDTHDLLGMGLSAVALKSDLAGRLIGRDDARARRELDALVRLAQQARAEVQAVTADGRRLSLRAELDAAAGVLASAGVPATIRTEPGPAPLPEQVDAALATLLRESVTNVLRHARARSCEIELTVDEGAARLQITNDGVVDGIAGDRRQAPERQYGGRGLANLSARAAALGGRLSAHAEGGRFELTVWVPLPPASARLGDEHPLAAGHPAHGVDEGVGRPVLDQES